MVRKDNSGESVGCRLTTKIWLAAIILAFAALALIGQTWDFYYFHIDASKVRVWGDMEVSNSLVVSNITRDRVLKVDSKGAITNSEIHWHNLDAFFTLTPTQYNGLSDGQLFVYDSAHEKFTNKDAAAWHELTYLGITNDWTGSTSNVFEVKTNDVVIASIDNEGRGTFYNWVSNMGGAVVVSELWGSTALSLQSSASFPYDAIDLQVEADGPGAAELWLQQNAGPVMAPIVLGAIKATNNASSVARTVFEVTTNGWVSVNTNDHTEELIIQGDAWVAGNWLSRGGSAKDYGYFGNSEFNRYHPYDNAGKGGLVTAGNFYYQLDSNNDQTNTGFYVYKDSQYLSGGTEIFRIQENGFIGANTNAPRYMVDVHGTVAATNFLLKVPQWDDVRIPMSAIRPGVASPDAETFVGNTRALSFDDSTDQSVEFELQIPHGVITNNEYGIRIHLHWTALVASDVGDKVVWGLEWVQANPAAEFPGSANTVYFTNEIYVLRYHHIDHLTTITNVKESAVIVGRLFRDADNTTDDQIGEAFALSLDAHIPRVKMGSSAEFGDY